MKLTQLEAIRKALLARGEREVTLQNVIKWHVFTRTWMGLRDAHSALVPNCGAKYWLLGCKQGNLRLGDSSGTSRRTNKTVHAALVAEGRALS